MSATSRARLRMQAHVESSAVDVVTSRARLNPARALLIQERDDG
jgi:hypothetical protein